MVNTAPSTVKEWTRALTGVVAIIGWIPDSAMSAAHAPCAEHAHAAACCRRSAAVRAEKPQNNCYVWSV